MTLLRILVRRWYVVVPTLAITALAASGLASAADPRYETSASVMLMVRNEPAAEETEAAFREPNPYLDISGSLVTTTRILADVLNSPSTQAELYAAGHLPGYEVTAGDRLPTLELRVSGPDPGEVQATVDALVKRTANELTRIQDAVGAPPDRRIVPTLLVAPAPPITSTAHASRALVAVVILGLLAAVSLALMTESYWAGRRRRDEGGRDERERPDHDRDGATPASAARERTPRDEPSTQPIPRDEPSTQPTPRDEPASQPTARDKPARQPAPRDEPSTQPTPRDEPSTQPTPRDEPASQPTARDKPARQPAPQDEPATQPTSRDEPSPQPTPGDEPASQPTARDKPARQPAPQDEPATQPTSRDEPSPQPTTREPTHRDQGTASRPEPARSRFSPAEEPDAEGAGSAPEDRRNANNQLVILSRTRARRP